MTHGHLDHILGLGGLLSTFLRWEAIEELEIYGGHSTLERVRTLLFDVVLRGNQPPMPLVLKEIKPGVIFDAEDLTVVTAFSVTHRGPDCLGYIFEEKSRRPVLSQKADELVVPFGPERRDLVDGKEITLADCTRIKPDYVLGAWEKGSKLVLVGVTPAEQTTCLKPARMPIRSSSNPHISMKKQVVAPNLRVPTSPRSIHPSPLHKRRPRLTTKLWCVNKINACLVIDKSNFRAT